MGFPRRLLADDEQLVLVLRPHVKQLVVPAGVLMFVAGLTGLLLGLVPDSSIRSWVQLIIGGFAALVLVRYVLWPFLQWWNTLYVLTTNRLLIRRGVLSRSGQDMPLARLTDVSFEHSLWERILGCGTLIVQTAGEHGQLELHDIPKVEHVQRTLYQLADDARYSGDGRAANPRDAIDPELADDIEHGLTDSDDVQVEVRVEDALPDEGGRRRFGARRRQ